MRVSFRHILSLFLLAASLAACQREEPVYEAPAFPVERQAEVRLISDTALIAYPYGLCADDSTLYVLSPVEGRWLHAFDRRTGAHVCSGVATGQGPDEAVSCALLHSGGNPPLLHVYDDASQRLLSFRPDTDTHSFRPAGSHSFAGEEAVVRKAWPLSDGVFLIDGQMGAGADGLKRFQVCDSIRVTSEYSNLPIADKSMESVFLLESMALSPDGNHLAAATLWGGILETFRIRDGQVIPAATRFFLRPELDLTGGMPKPNERTTYGFVSLAATDSLLYTVWLGGRDPNAEASIAVFDWEGNPVARYTTGCQLLRIALAPGDGRHIYAVAHSEERGFHLVCIDLGE